MANNKLDTGLLDRAMKFAIDAHSGTERRGKGFPYIVHPMEAVSIVASITPDQELLAAAALHDTVEDTDIDIDRIRKEFGDRIADLVEAESDKFIEGISEGDSWHDRKQAAITRIAEAPYDAKIVALGDKLSNMRAIEMDYQMKGDALWNIFHVKDRSEHEWHYRGLAESLKDLSHTAAYKEFLSLINKVFGKSASNDSTSVKFTPIKGRCGEIVEYIMNCPEIPSDEQLQFKIRLCVEEAVQNVVDYAYSDGLGYLEAGTFIKGDSLYIFLKDAGVPFDPLENGDPDITAAVEDRQIGGLGIFLCKQMMDGIKYNYESGCNILTMSIKIR